jgi:hypothetical protein
MHKYTILNAADLPSINFDDILTTSSETIRTNLDGSKFLIKWQGALPYSVGILNSYQKSYTNEEIVEALLDDEWNTSSQQ